MKLYYKQLQIDGFTKYIEIDKERVIKLLIQGRRDKIFLETSFFFRKNNIKQGYLEYRLSTDEELEAFLENTKKLKVKVDVDMTEAKQYLKDNIELLNKDIIIGIDKNLKLPTVFIDGEPVTDGIVDLDLRWITNDGLPRPKSFRLNTISKYNEDKILRINYGK